MWVLRHQMISKWPLNDLKWPTRTWKLNFLTKSHFGACNMSFHRFFGRRVDCADQIWVLSHQMTAKWHLNVLKWPIRTWKLNFLTKSHFGSCKMSFHSFFLLLSWMRSSDLSFESPNDLQMTSKWPQVTHKDLKT